MTAPLWLVEARWALAWACVATAAALFAALFAMKAKDAVAKSATFRWFMCLPLWGKGLFLAAAIPFVAWAADKPEYDVVRGITLEPVEVTSTNATLKYSVDSSAGTTVVSNRTAWIYRKAEDDMWRLVMTVHGLTGQNFETTIDGFFPDRDSDWKIIMSGEDGTDE